VDDGHGRASPRDQGRLTPEQREVAGLIAAGLTDDEIASRLAPQREAVADHVEAILQRLGFQRRIQIAA
jgi:DNA-binding NarL/FixJ family response regulator